MALPAKLVDIYKGIESGFGLFFCFVFGVTQLLLIFSSFMAISKPLGSSDALFVKSVCSLGNVIVCSGLMLNIASLTFVLETGHRSVTGLVKHLQEKLLADVPDRMVIKILVKELSDLKPMTGNGYFSITKATLTSMVSVGITYIIILVQFKISAS